MLVILLTLIFIRPFISSLAFDYLNFAYSTVILCFLSIWLIRKGLPLKAIKPLKIPLILFTIALLVSVIFSGDKIQSLKELYKYASGVSCLMFAASLTNEHKNRLVKTIILAALLISLWAIYQYLFGFRHLLDYLAKSQTPSSFVLDYIQRKRVYSPFVTPNTLGGYLAMIILLAVSLWHKRKRLLTNPCFFILIPISAALFLTKSLGAFLSGLFGLVIFFYLQGKLDKKRLVVLASFLIIILAVFIIRQAAIKEHAQPVFSLAKRIDYWKGTLEVIKTNPLFGAGLGNFNLAQSRFAHNSYLQIWAEMGILGLVSVLWLIIAWFKCVAKNLKHSLNQSQLIGLAAASSVFLIHNLVDFSFFLPEVAIIWWIILGLFNGVTACD